MVRLVGSQEIIKTNLSKHQQIHQQKGGSWITRRKITPLPLLQRGRITNIPTIYTGRRKGNSSDSSFGAGWEGIMWSFPVVEQKSWSSRHTESSMSPGLFCDLYKLLSFYGFRRRFFKYLAEAWNPSILWNVKTWSSSPYREHQVRNISKFGWLWLIYLLQVSDSNVPFGFSGFLGSGTGRKRWVWEDSNINLDQNSKPSWKSNDWKKYPLRASSPQPP